MIPLNNIETLSIFGIKFSFHVQQKKLKNMRLSISVVT